MELKKVIISKINDILEGEGHNLLENINDKDILLESGLDSMGFAILVAELEEELGFDPFILEEEPIYPRTFGEFFNLYEKHSSSPK